MAKLSGPHRSQASDLHRRDVDQDQHDPASRLGAEGRAPRRQGPAGQVENRDVPCPLRNDRIDAPCLFDGPINGERFRAYVEQFLVPTLKPGDAVILDNLGSHKGKEVRKAIRAVGARLVFLPKYSPDLNPIEQVFASSRLCCERPKREATRRSPTQALKSSPTTRPPNAPHTSRTQDTGKAKCRRLLKRWRRSWAVAASGLCWPATDDAWRSTSNGCRRDRRNNTLFREHRPLALVSRARSYVLKGCTMSEKLETNGNTARGESGDKSNRGNVQGEALQMNDNSAEGKKPAKSRAALGVGDKPNSHVQGKGLQVNENSAGE